MKIFKLKNIVIFVYLIMTLLVLIDMRELIEIVQFLVNLPEEISEYDKERIKAERLMLLIGLSAIKIIIFGILAILFTQKKLDKNKVTIKIAFFAFLIFMYFDLPIHRCYNGNLESFWEVGRHFH